MRPSYFSNNNLRGLIGKPRGDELRQNVFFAQPGSGR
jgi:hypothetical protein